MADTNSTLRGVGGWLALLVALLALLSPLGVAVSVLGLFMNPALPATYGEHWPLIRGVQLALAAVHIAGAWYLAWRLVAVHVPGTVRIVVAGLWLLGLGLVVVEAIAVASTGRVALGGLLSSAFAELAGNGLFCLVWTLYLLKSRRVANTYAADASAAAPGSSA